MTDVANSRARQQIEGSRFRSAVSESLLQEMQGNLNYLLSSILPIGSVIKSYLTQAQFQSETSNGWVIDAGQDISASDLSLLTGYTSLADLRGVYLRGKNNGRADGKQNPDGELAIGAYQADGNLSHDHDTIGVNGEVGGIAGPPSGGYDTVSAAHTGLSGLGGGNESRPRSVTLNTFVRIN